MGNEDFSNGIEFDQYLQRENVMMIFVWYPEDGELAEEIILESCYHNETLEDLSDDEISSIMGKYGEMILELIESSVDHIFEELEDPESQEEDEWAELDAIKPLQYDE